MPESMFQSSVPSAPVTTGLRRLDGESTVAPSGGGVNGP